MTANCSIISVSLFAATLFSQSPQLHMKYVSTRGNKQECSFIEAFLNSYAEDGGLFCPKEIPRISDEQMKEWSVVIRNPSKQ